MCLSPLLSSPLHCEGRMGDGYSSSSSYSCHGHDGGGDDDDVLICEGEGVVMKRKRVMVVIDQSRGAREAMMWALTHVVNRGDHLTLLHALHCSTMPIGTAGGDYYSRRDREAATHLATSLASLCKACKQEVAVEALVIQGPKLHTVLSQVKKLDVSVLVLNQCKPKLFSCLFRSSNEAFVEECIHGAECLAIAVRKRSEEVGGYLVTTKLQKNFWLLA